MFRIRSFAVFASLFLAAPALADSQTSTNPEPATEQAAAVESEATAGEPAAIERRLSTRERWRGKPYVRAASLPDDPRAFMLPRLNNPTTPSAFNSGSVELRNEALNKQLPLPNLGSNPSF